MKKEHLHIVERVAPGSIAEELEIEAGDILVEINGTKIEDIFDDTYLELEKLAQAQSDYEIVNSRYDVYGICPKCQQKKANT